MLKFKTRESNIRSYNKKMDLIIHKFSHGELTKTEYIKKRSALEKSLLKKLAV